MKLTKDFQPNTEHPYTLAEGVEVQSAKFGYTQVDIFQEAEPSPIWRGEPKQIVGHNPVRFWAIVVHGELSCTTLTEAGAKAVGERRAWESQANYRKHSTGIEYLHQRAPEVEKAEMDQFYAILADVARRYPAMDSAHQSTLDEIIGRGADMADDDPTPLTSGF
jgi:hypothetical protein